jgi:hypothetical protein
MPVIVAAGAEGTPMRSCAGQGWQLGYCNPARFNPRLYIAQVLQCSADRFGQSHRICCMPSPSCDYRTLWYSAVRCHSYAALLRLRCKS